MLLTQLLRAPAGSRLVRAEFGGTALTLAIASTRPLASCPLRRTESWPVHNRYPRRLAEVPVLGHTVRLPMAVPRFFRPDPLCSRRIFAEPLDGLAGKHVRTTAGLARAHRAIGAAPGGEPQAQQKSHLASDRKVAFSGGGGNCKRISWVTSSDSETICDDEGCGCLHIACTDAALRELVANWHRLTPSVRAAIMDLARGDGVSGRV